MNSSLSASTETPPFELKGSLFTLTVLYLFRMNCAAIAHHLKEKMKQAPGFFKNAPVVVDLEGMKEVEDLDFNGLREVLQEHGLVPVGIRNGTPMQQAAARLSGLPTVLAQRSDPASEKSDSTGGVVSSTSRVVQHPVRSGQQIYVPGGNLIVLGAVSAGAEVIADGHIHIYGALRGRALAGAQGDAGARIFCQSLEAELISVAGRYRISEQLDTTHRGKPAQIFLTEEERLVIAPLPR